MALLHSQTGPARGRRGVVKVSRMLRGGERVSWSGGSVCMAVIYILGGPSDIAYPNGMDDFARIGHVPVAVANLPVGHGGIHESSPANDDTHQWS